MHFEPLPLMFIVYIKIKPIIDTSTDWFNRWFAMWRWFVHLFSPSSDAFICLASWSSVALFWLLWCAVCEVTVCALQVLSIWSRRSLRFVGAIYVLFCVCRTRIIHMIRTIDEIKMRFIAFSRAAANQWAWPVVNVSSIFFFSRQ